MTGPAHGIDRSTTIRDRRRGRVTECDLCLEERWCVEQDGLSACGRCQLELLPQGWGL
ncbi:hypothetical protein [Haloarcula salinisoli]|uniref:Uncharacterized protein n=1 Tax=Haloarcula salinisoli TaxID=2487746 RepID=A0A8J8CCW8_9EURY|nr:hypothetical protein [Halomicroarcula salinisoli]MBX0304030.1 hypothetical protein [Halomicroarcula salinisoli]